MLTEKQEEILQAVWGANETGAAGLETIRHSCPVEIGTSDLEELLRQELLVRTDGEIRLSEEGRKLAKPIVRRHRLAEVLLTSILDLKYPEMEKIACQVEHSLAPEVEESICTLLGHPEVCPDGKPIPAGRCCASGLKITERAVQSLTELKAGERGKITYIKPISHSNFHQLISFGLHPGVVVTVHRKLPAFCIKFENTELALDREIARNIYVWKLGGLGRP